MAEFDRLFTLKEDATDSPPVQVEYLSTLFNSPSAVMIEAARLFDVGGFGRRSRITIYFTGLVNNVETPLNDVVFVDDMVGLPIGSEFTILNETQTTTTAATFQDNPVSAPAGVTRALNVQVSPGVTAVVENGTLAEIITPAGYTPPVTTPAERKIWARLLEKNVLENVVTIADDQGSTRDVKVTQETARFATRYAPDITNRKLIVDDAGVEWDILGIVELAGRRKDIIIEAIREEMAGDM